MVIGIFYGMIVNINNWYDILIYYDNNLINKQFNNFIDCLNFVNNL
jgi:hypothetical protein